MSAKKSIAIVGATEKIGEEIATQFMNSNYSLLLISNNKDRLNYLAKKMADKKPKAEINFMECVKDGCWEADIIILAVPHDEEKMVAEIMKEVATQKIVVSVSNEENACGELQKILPYSKLVRVSGDFNSKELIIKGDNETVNEPALAQAKEIKEIFNQAGYHTIIENYFYKN
ncbi:MAG TPA: NAD(P)-binding domain-containing protein [Hanamia sp.]|nr:NAD(P)-binding domain-containing protein [Hanamia sp.]